MWEETLLHVHARADSWVWCDDEEEGAPGVNMVSSSSHPPDSSLKPRPEHSKAAKVGLPAWTLFLRADRPLAVQGLLVGALLDPAATLATQQSEHILCWLPLAATS